MQCRNDWRITNPNIIQGITSIMWIITSKLVIDFGFISANTKLKVKVKILNHSVIDSSQFWIKLVIMIFG